MNSRQVNWFEVYGFVERWASNRRLDGQHDLSGLTLLAGTPQWCGLPDDDARKLMAVILGGVREALVNDTHQAAMADASKAIAAAADWSTVGKPRGAAYIPREVA